MENVKFIVKRDSSDEMTMATVTAKVSDGLVTERTFLMALKKALTKWAKTIPSGQEAWKMSSHDFNLGDLDGYLPASGKLKNILGEVGIVDLTLDILSEDRIASGWSYDTILMDLDD